MFFTGDLLIDILSIIRQDARHSRRTEFTGYVKSSVGKNVSSSPRDVRHFHLPLYRTRDYIIGRDNFRLDLLIRKGGDSISPHRIRSRESVIQTFDFRTSQKSYFLDFPFLLKRIRFLFRWVVLISPENNFFMVRQA